MCKPEARAWAEREKRTWTRGLVRGLQCPGGAILFTTKVIATTYNFSVQVSVSPVSFVVAVVVPHVVSRVLLSCRVGVVVAIVTPHSVLQLLLSCCVASQVLLSGCVVSWSRSRLLRHVWVAVVVFVPRVVLQLWSLRRMGVAGAVVAPCVVLRLLLSHCTWHCGHCCWAAWCRGCDRTHCAACGSWLRSLRQMWCCSHGHYAACRLWSLRHM